MRFDDEKDGDTGCATLLGGIVVSTSSNLVECTNPREKHILTYARR